MSLPGQLQLTHGRPTTARTARPNLDTFSLGGDRYFGLVADGLAADYFTPILRVPAEVAHMVKVEWPKPAGAARRGLRHAREVTCPPRRSPGR